MSGPDKYTKADETTAAARKIIDAQKRKQDAKTARLRDARLASEATGAGEAGHHKIEEEVGGEGEAMKVSPLANLNAACKQWTERRRELATGMVQGAASLSLSDDSLSEQFIQTQTQTRAKDRILLTGENLE